MMSWLVLFISGTPTYKTGGLRNALDGLIRGVKAITEGATTFGWTPSWRQGFAKIGENFNEVAENILIGKKHIQAHKDKMWNASAKLYRKILQRKGTVRELFQSVVEAAPNGLLMVDENGIIIMANSQIEGLFYYATKDLLGQPIELLIPERFRTQHLAQRQAFYKAPKAGPMGGGREFLALRKDGSEFPVDIRLSPVKTATGTHILASILDISERKSMEEEIWRSKERFRSMIENVRDHAIIMLDTEGHVLTWNKGAEKLRGYGADEIIGKNYSCFYPVEDRESRKPEQLLHKALAEGQCEDEGWRLRRDGSSFWATCVIATVRDSKGAPIGFSHVAHDLTRHRHVEEELRKAKEEADAANKAKSAFLANISHEIRTPMTGVLGMTGLLADTELSPNQREYCELIRRSGESLLTVINEVLDFSKIESGKLQLELIDFELRSAVEEVVNLFAKEAADKGVELINFIRSDVPMKLCGDPGRLRQILANLISNALKFTEEGEVVVRVTVLKETATAANLRFSVTDTGIGIPQEKLDNLFYPFSQIDASITRKYGGTGLGLAICRKLVELLGGQIGVYSSEGRGSTFWFKQLLKQPASVGETVTPHANLHGLRMLVVEGNSTNRGVLHHYLTSLGIKSQSAADGQNALKRLRIAAKKGEPFNLAILGLQLPGMDGLELAKTIKQDPQIDSVKLLLLTSVTQKVDAKLVQEAGVDSCLTKPISFSCLSNCLAMLMEQAPKGKSSSSLVTRQALAELEIQQRSRVLVADDNHINQKVTAALLEKMGHRVDIVGNGKEAIEAFRMVPYDVILMDVQMPEMDGFEASRRIRVLEEKTGRHTPVIAITAYARNEDRDNCIAAGMDDYISKPIKPHELKAAIAHRVTGTRTTPSTNAEPDLALQAEVVDFSEALAQLEGDRELLCEIAQIFLDQHLKLIEEARQALSRSDYRSLKAVAHALGSSVGQLAARRALAAAKKLEFVSDSGDISLVPKALAELDKELQLLRSAVLESSYSSLRPISLLH
jgi:two-component system sensor histidine kinase/response regulator